jgi:GDP-L-fucose synthase
MKRVFVTGKSGLVGSSVIRAYYSDIDVDVSSTTSSELDLLNYNDVQDALDQRRPDVVIMAAARVGGIAANVASPATFMVENTLMQTNLMSAANKTNVPRLIFLSSACVYPLSAEFPLRENDLLSGDVEPTTKPYAIAKILGMEMVKAYASEESRDWISVIPSNIYGPGDNFSQGSSHVMASLLIRFLRAIKNGESTVEVWGTGSAMREFTHVDDLASGIKVAERMYHSSDPMNIGSGQEISIAELAELVLNISGFKGRLVFDSSKPDGAPRKLQDSSKIKSLGWSPKIELTQGISQTYDWLEKNLPLGNVRA